MMIMILLVLDWGSCLSGRRGDWGHVWLAWSKEDVPFFLSPIFFLFFSFFFAPSLFLFISFSPLLVQIFFGCINVHS